MSVLSSAAAIALPRAPDLAGLADIVFGTAPGTDRIIVGATRDTLLQAIETVEPPPERLALLIVVGSASNPEQIIDTVLDRLADTASRLWPRWFSGADFSACGNDSLGRAATRVKAKDAAAAIPHLLRPWAEAAALLALDGRVPRVPATNAATELTQLCLAINRAGLVLIIDATASQAHAPALVHALEWLSRTAPMPVIALFDALPDFASPFDRILHGAVVLTTPAAAAPPGDGVAAHEGDHAAADGTWLGPVSGGPHPLSVTEQRVWAALASDPELAPLFVANCVVETVHGKRPRVDLLWTKGRMVVELDGYPDHSQFTKFVDDRHRDYELILSGYTVLRLANDEVAQDIQKAVEKIRNIAGICRTRLHKGD